MIEFLRFKSLTHKDKLTNCCPCHLGHHRLVTPEYEGEGGGVYGLFSS